MGSSGNDLESNIFQSVQQSVMQMFGGLPHGASSGPSGILILHREVNTYMLKIKFCTCDVFSN